MSESNAKRTGEGTPFNLAAPPFGECVDDSFFFPSDQHLRAIEFMGRILWTRARFGVVTAAGGCGKSLIIRRLVRDLDERIVVAVVNREDIEPREFLLEVLRQFGFTLEDNDKSDRRRLLERFLHHQASLGRVCVVIVENAQSMHPAVLEELRCMAALEVEGVRTLKVLLVGQPSLSHVIGSPRMAELITFSVPRFSLNAFNEDQTAMYVALRLRAAGATNPGSLIPYTLMPQIHACTGGVPAQINRLCERALVCASKEEASQVTVSALNRAIAQLGLQDRMISYEARGAQPAPEESFVSEDDARIVVQMQGLAEQEMVLGANRILIGRGEDADVCIDSVFVSRYHALIMRNGEQDLLLDLGSTNGVLVNSVRIVRRVLKHRDLIQVGPAKVTYLNPLAIESSKPDPAETICFARPGFPVAAGEEDETATVLAFGRDTSGT